MKIFQNRCLAVTAVFVLTAASFCINHVSAQVSTEVTKTPRAATGSITIDSADVVYVSGDDAVLKMPDGSLELLEVPSGSVLTIDGKPAKISDLKPGATVSHLTSTKRVEYDVQEVTQFSGRISAKNGRLLTVRLDDGTTKVFSVPYHATFNVGGQNKEFGDLVKGMKIDVTAVKKEQHSTQTSHSAVSATTPTQSGTLVILR